MRKWRKGVKVRGKLGSGEEGVGGEIEGTDAVWRPQLVLSKRNEGRVLLALVSFLTFTAARSHVSCRLWDKHCTLIDASTAY
jgi:hypothetical protein